MQVIRATGHRYLELDNKDAHYAQEGTIIEKDRNLKKFKPFLRRLVDAAGAGLPADIEPIKDRVKKAAIDNMGEVTNWLAVDRQLTSEYLTGTVKGV